MNDHGAMKIWLPYTSARSGSTVFMKALAEGFHTAGFDTELQEFPHLLQYAPELLSRIAPPPGTQVVITNSWNGFAFHRPGLVSICVEHLFVLDKNLSPYKARAQATFHRLFVSRFNRQSYTSADRVVAVSDYTCRSVRAYFPWVEPEVILNGVDTDFFTPADDPAKFSPNTPFRLLFAGNVTNRKGADLIPEIMRRLGNGFLLHYTGDPHSVPAYFRGDNIVALGRLTRPDMRDAYRRCDALLAPTRMEGLPLSVLEALACGRPIICSNSSSLPEAVIDGKTGTICPVDDIDAFVAAIRDLAGDPERHRQMSQNARDDAVQRFSFSRMLDEYIRLIARLC